MRVQVSARSGTITPNSSEPKRVRVAGFVCRKFLISWSIEMPLAQPAGVSRAALDVAGEQLDAGQQAADAAHVVVAVAADLVADAVQDRACGPGTARAACRLSLSVKFAPSSSGQKVVGHDAVGAEHHDQPLLAAAGVGEAEARAGSGRTAARPAPMPRSRRNSRRERSTRHSPTHFRGSVVK